ncbi:MAG: flagellar motor switch protein FliN [Alphaproteobacteria bacterium]
MTFLDEENQENENTAEETAEIDADAWAAEAEDASENGASEGTGGNLGAIYDVPVQVSAVLGTAALPVNQLLKLGRGAVVELDRKVGEAIDIFVNDRLVARGEVVIMDDHLGVTMTEIIKSELQGE